MKRRILEKIFKKKLRLSPTKGTKHRLYYKKYKGQEIFKIPVSRTHDEIDDDIMREMAQECFLRLGEFKKSVDCTFSNRWFHASTIDRWGKKYDTT
jgi:hypothetical protein